MVNGNNAEYARGFVAEIVGRSYPVPIRAWVHKIGSPALGYVDSDCDNNIKSTLVENAKNEIAKLLAKNSGVFGSNSEFLVAIISGEVVDVYDFRKGRFHVPKTPLRFVNGRLVPNESVSYKGLEQVMEDSKVVLDEEARLRIDEEYALRPEAALMQAPYLGELQPDFTAFA